MAYSAPVGSGLAVAHAALLWRVCGPILRSPEKADALSEFLQTYDLALALMSLAVSARTAGHPAYQGTHKDIAGVRMTEMHVAHLALTREIGAWLSRKAECTRQQPRLTLLTTSQQLDLVAAIPDARAGQPAALARSVTIGVGACGGAGVWDGAGDGEVEVWECGVCVFS